MMNQRLAIECLIDDTLVGLVYPQVVLQSFGLSRIAGHDRGAVKPRDGERDTGTNPDPRLGEPG